MEDLEELDTNIEDEEYFDDDEKAYELFGSQKPKQLDLFDFLAA
ncbi:MAG: hypothetical protein ACMV1K_11530 [Sulfurospirillum sp.]|jgi:hypothetical protein